MPCWVSPPRPSSQRSLLGVTALQGAKADATLLASYATNAALSASETTLQSALDAILAELAALQLSGSGGVVNAPTWAGCNLHLEAPLSAALANGEAATPSQRRTRPSRLRCWPATPPHKWTPCWETTARQAPFRPRCWPTTPRRKWTRCWETTARQARRTRRRRPPSQARCWPTGRARTRMFSQPTKSPPRWRRTAADPDTATASSIAAALLSYYTSAQVDGLLAGKLGVTEAASALQIAVRYDGGADEVVAAIGEQTSHCQTGRFAPAAAQRAWTATP